MCESGRVFLELAEHLRNGKFDQGDAVELLSESDVDEDEDELERIGESLEKVEDGLVEPANMADDEADDRSAPHDGENAECDTQGYAP